MAEIQDFMDVSRDPNAYARSLKETGRRIIGYFCSYGPEEIIQAAGLHPMRIFGTGEDTGLSDKHLQSYCCSLARGILAGSLSGSLGFLDGTVIPHTCDTIQRLSDIWRLNTRHGFFADVVLPVKLNTESARQYMIDVLAGFRKDLEQYFGLSISDEDLQASITLFNSIRSRLAGIAALRSKNPAIMPGSVFSSLVKASMVMDRQRLNELLAVLLDGLKDKAADARGRRIMLVGGVCDQPDIYSLIERSGGQVAWDDLCTGTRSFDTLIDPGADPVAAIAQRYFDRQVCPAKHRSPFSRAEHILALVKEHGIEGVIFLQLKFCDPHSFDYPDLKGALAGSRVPSMLLEIEDRLPPEGQLLTRIESFIQMI